MTNDKILNIVVRLVEESIRPGHGLSGEEVFDFEWFKSNFKLWLNNKGEKE